MYAVAFAPDGMTLVATHSSEVLFWDLSAGRPQARPALPVRQSSILEGLSFSPDGKLLALSSRVAAGREPPISLWEFRGGTPREWAQLPAPRAPRLSLAFAPDGKTLAVVSDAVRESSLELWGLNGDAPKKRITVKGLTGGTTAVAFAPDGKTLAVAGGSLTRKPLVTLLDLGGDEPTVRDTLEEHTRPVLFMAFTRDGKTLITHSADGMIRLWDMSGARAKQQAKLPGVSIHMVFAADGKVLASLSSSGVSLWDVKGAQLVPRSAGVDDVPRLRAMALAPDGRTLA